MSTWRDLLAGLIKSGPENVKQVIQALDNMPSDRTLNRLIDTIDKFTPYLPMLKSLEGFLGPQNLLVLENLARTCPDKATLDKLAAVLPYLQNLPDKETLTKLLSKADSLEGLIKSLDMK